MRNSDLSRGEQRNVRTAIRFLHYQARSWEALAKMLHYEIDTIGKVLRGGRPVTPALAFRVARFVGGSIDALLEGRLVPAGTCPYCGHPPGDDSTEGNSP
jgi:hypothetical protein